MQARGFSANDFALSHPGGRLGKRLLLRVDDISHKLDAIPIVNEQASIREALLEVTTKKLGMTCVVDNHGNLVGIYTDGDVRRTLTQNYDINTTILAEVMTKNCRTIQPNLLAVEALALMQRYSITALVIVEDNKPSGVVHLHDLLKAGIY